MARIENDFTGDTNFGEKPQTLNCVGTFQEATKNEERDLGSTPESKQLSPGKSVSSEDTQETAASSVDAKEVEEDFLPEWIKNKKYSEIYEEADKQLWEDLRKEDEETGGSFLEQAFIKHIFIDVVTRQAYVEMPTTKYHEEVTYEVGGVVNLQSTQARPVLAKANGGIDLTTGSFKKPDIFIFGQDRLEIRNIRRAMTVKKIQFNPMNPNAIIEVSWTNNLENELAKFALQMNRYCDELGAINVGYLIKFIPRDRGQYPTANEPGRPLVGIDVYRMEPGETIYNPDQPFSRWRHGENYPDDLEITGEHLGQDPQGEGVSIPFDIIVDVLTELGVVFEAPPVAA